MLIPFGEHKHPDYTGSYSILEIDMDKKDIRAYSKPLRGQSIELLRDLNI